MKFLEAVEQKLKLLEAGDLTAPVDPNQQPADAAMPGSAPQGAPEPAPVTPDEVDDMGADLQAQTQEIIKTCTDTVHALAVFIRGKFADQIAVDPALTSQLQQIEKTSTITDVNKITPDLLFTIQNLVNDITGS